MLLFSLPFCCFQLYSLLSFVEPGVFEKDLSEEFVENYSDVSINSGESKGFVEVF